MLETLLRTKLYIPAQRPNLVPRPQLIDRLNRGLAAGHRLTLLSTPAAAGIEVARLAGARTARDEQLLGQAAEPGRY